MTESMEGYEVGIEEDIYTKMIKDSFFDIRLQSNPKLDMVRVSGNVEIPKSFLIDLEDKEEESELNLKRNIHQKIGHAFLQTLRQIDELDEEDTENA